jgi:hypothetical protein
MARIMLTCCIERLLISITQKLKEVTVMKFIRDIKVIILAMGLVLSVMVVPGYSFTHDGGSGGSGYSHRGNNNHGNYDHGSSRHNDYDRGHNNGYRHYDRGHSYWYGSRYDSYRPYYRYYEPSFSFFLPGFSFYVSP